MKTQNPHHADPTKMTVEELRHCLIHWGDHADLEPYVEQLEKRLAAQWKRIALEKEQDRLDMARLDDPSIED